MLAFLSEDLSFTWDVLKIAVILKAVWCLMHAVYKRCFQ